MSDKRKDGEPGQAAAVTRPAERNASAPRDREADRPQKQPPLDVVDWASMDSFPCSDPPGYHACHS